VKFDFEPDSGRVAKVRSPRAKRGARPSPGPSPTVSPSSGAPAVQATLTAPWGAARSYTLKDGRLDSVVDKGVETLLPDDATPAVDAPIPARTSGRSSTILDDGRLKRLTRPDLSEVR